MKGLIIYLDKKYVKISAQELLELSPGIVGTIGVFETMRVCKGKIIEFGEHYKRLVRGLKVYGIRAPMSLQKFKEISEKICRQNKLKNARLRIAVWKDKRQIHISVVVQKILTQTKGYKACISLHKRNKSGKSHIKSIGYEPFRTALIEAKRSGLDEAFLFNNKGYLVEGSHTNIFVVKKNIVYTPKVSDGCLNGVTRKRVIYLLRQMGTKCKVGHVTKKSILAADEIFITNSIIEVMPVIYLKANKIWRYKVGSITLEIKRKYQQFIQQSLMEYIL